MLWEYKTVQLETKYFRAGKVDAAQLDALMNDLGLDGWELAEALATRKIMYMVSDAVLIFKRPKER